MTTMHCPPPADAAVISTGELATPCTVAVGRWVLAAAVLGSSMAFIDGTAVSIALPVIQTELAASVTQMQWVVESYALLLAAFLLVGGALGDRLGRRRVFAWGVVIFALASVWCGLAPNANQLIAARGVQGLGGALMVSGSLALISASFEEQRRGQAIGTWSAFTAVTAALGPVLGGWLVTNLSWRWVFFINVPVAVVVLIILMTRVPESRNEEAQPSIDWAGAVLGVLGLGGVVVGLIESANRGLADPAVLGLMGGGLALLLLFLVVESRVSNPMMPLSVFRSRNFSAANLVTLLLYATLSGPLFFLSFNLIQVQGYTATAAGAAWLPFVVILAALSRWAGGLINKYGAKLPLVVGPSIVAGAFALMALPGIGGSYWTTFFLPITVMGIGMAISVAPLTTVVMNSVPKHQAGVASGVNNAVSRTAGLLAIAIFGVVMFASFNAGLDSRVADLGVPDAVVRQLEDERVRLAGAELPDGLEQALASNLQRAIDESFVSGFRVVALISVGTAGACALIALAFIGGQRSRETQLA